MGENWSWIKDVFSNKLVILILILILVLAPYYIASDANVKVAIIAFILLLAIIALLLQYIENKKVKTVEKEVLSESKDKEKDLLKRYIGWNKEEKEAFSIFSRVGRVYYKELLNGSVIVCTDESCEPKEIIKKQDGIRHQVQWTRLKAKKVAIANMFVKKGLAIKHKASEGDKYTFYLELTIDGKLLLEKILEIESKVG